jgi:hypothetical protein
MKLEVSRQIFKKYLNIKCRENSFMGAKLFTRAGGRTDRRTDRHYKANSCLSELRENARIKQIQEKREKGNYKKKN